MYLVSFAAVGVGGFIFRDSIQQCLGCKKLERKTDRKDKSVQDAFKGHNEIGVDANIICKSSLKELNKIGNKYFDIKVQISDENMENVIANIKKVSGWVAAPKGFKSETVKHTFIERIYNDPFLFNSDVKIDIESKTLGALTGEQEAKLDAFNIKVIKRR